MTTDFLLQQRNGIKHVNLMEFIKKQIKVCVNSVLLENVFLL